MKNKFAFGHMRLKSNYKTTAVDLLTYMLSKGLKKFHSSIEYENFDFFAECLLEACDICKIDSNNLSHIIKVGYPNFQEEVFQEDRLQEIVYNYSSRLRVNTIDSVQWMLRWDLQDEKKRVQILKKYSHKIKNTIKILKKEKKINNFGCFPYTLEFAKVALNEIKFDFMIEYCNILEYEKFDFIHKNIKDSQYMISIRPFCGGKLFEQGNSYIDSLKFLKNYKKIKSIICSPGSKKHFDQLWSFETN